MSFIASSILGTFQLLRVCRHSHKMGSHNKTLFAHRTFCKNFRRLICNSIFENIEHFAKWKYEEDIVAHHCRLAYNKLHNYHFTLPLETRNWFKCSNVWVKVLLLNRPMHGDTVSLIHVVPTLIGIISCKGRDHL